MRGCTVLMCDVDETFNIVSRGCNPGRVGQVAVGVMVAYR